MAAAIEDEESWLYGDPNAEESNQPPGDEAPFGESTGTEIDDSHDEIVVKKEVVDLEEDEAVDDDRDGITIDESEPAPTSVTRKGDDREAGELSGGEEDGGAVLVMEDGSGDSDSDDDDDVQVTIGDIKTSPVYGYGGPSGGFTFKHSVVPPGSGSKAKGEIDVDSVGMINGIPAYEFNLDSLEEKPWRKPGADITDYFNYGFNEESWKIYCEKQRKLRGDGPAIVVSKSTSHMLVKDQQIPVASMNDNSKYSAGPPPGRKFSGAIDVIGGTSSTSRRPVLTPPKENVIQVMTGDKRDFIRKPFMEGNMLPSGGPPPHLPPSGFIPPDLSIPPPVMAPPIPGMPPPGMPPPGIPLPPPPAGIPPGYPDPYGGYPRYPIPPMGGVAGPPDRSQTPGYEPRPPFYGPSNPGGFGHYDAPGDGQWEPRDRPDPAFPPNWDYPHERSSERSPQRSPSASHEDEGERKHSDRHRDKDRDRERTRDKDRDRDRDTEKSRDRERDRDRDRDYDYEDRRSRDKDRERRHRDRDRDKEHRSSRRKHRDDDDSEHRSSRHKRKRSKRDKDDDADTKDSGSMSENPVPPIVIKEEKKD